MPSTTRRSRPKVSLAVQVGVFFRDGWLCHWCHRPVVFAPTFRLLDLFVRESRGDSPLAYFHPNWSRRSAPLLDHLGAVVDHVEAFSKGGRDEASNFVTSCNKCNARKNDRSVSAFTREHPGRVVRGKYGEPQHWDGLASLFLVLAERGIRLNPGERRWAQAMRAHLDRR
jgi:5-methylcytosine-specific restriction endonuclease McrA